MNYIFIKEIQVLKLLKLNINNLPENITHLTLGYEFTQNINNQMLKLPNKLTNLIISAYEKPIIEFPKSLTHITIK